VLSDVFCDRWFVPRFRSSKFHFFKTAGQLSRASYRQDVLPFVSNPENHRFLEGGQEFKQPIEASGHRYFVVSYGANPLLWISCNSPDTHRIYQRFFESLGIDAPLKALVDHDERIVMYCGFVVIGDRAPGHSWHVDYAHGANAYTLITPLFELEPGHGHLLYKMRNDRTETYRYRLGEAIVFGDRFLHTTEPYGQCDRARVLVSLTVGTDKVKYWPVLEKTIGVQSNYLVLPCGHAAGSCRCLNGLAQT
jgi:hypothetical protein